MELDTKINAGDEDNLRTDLGGGAGDGDDFGIDDLGEGAGVVDELENITPKVWMEFPSQQDAYKFYNRYALKMGFGTRWSSTEHSRIDRTLVITRRFVCRKQGKRGSLKKGNVDEDFVSREIRVDCKAMMKIILTKSGSWRVSIFVPEHANHEMSTPSKVVKHWSHKKAHRQPIVKNLMTRLHSEDISNSDLARVVNSCKSELDPEHMITSQVHDHLRVERKNNLGKNCAQVIKHFIEKKPKSTRLMLGDDVGVFKVDRDRHWCIRYKCNKALEIAYKSPNFAKEFDRFLTRKFAEYDNLGLSEGVNVSSQASNIQVEPIAQHLSQNAPNLTPLINIRDPTELARHKGPPKITSRVPYGLEASQEESNKKRKTCGFCGEKGHYRTGCSKAKAKNVALAGSQSH